MIDETDTIFIGMPVRDRAPIIWKVLQALVRQTYRLDLISLYFFTNDNVDNTILRLSKFISTYSHKFSNILFEVEDRNVPRDSRLSMWRQKFGLPQIAYSYNKCIEMAIKSGCKYLFLMDSDEILPDTTFIRLIDQMKEENIKLITGVIHHEKTGYTNIFNEKKGMLSLEELKKRETYIVPYICGSKMILISSIGNKRFTYDGDMSYDLNFIDKFKLENIQPYVNTGIMIEHLQF